MLRIGLTGGIGSGKSTLGALFQGLGAAVLDADQIAKELTCPGQAAFDAILAHFGSDYLRDGQLDRSRLRQLIFEDVSQRLWLEGFLHPLIYEEMDRRAACLGDGAAYLIFMVPLILETGKKGWVDRLLVVDLDAKTQRERLMSRDGMDEALMDLILKTQCSREQRLMMADDVISNAGTLACLQLQAESLHLRYVLISKGC